MWETDLQFQLSFYPHCSAKGPYSLSSYFSSPAVFGVFALSSSKTFSQLAVTCMCSLESTESLDKKDLSLIFLQIVGKDA